MAEMSQRIAQAKRTIRANSYDGIECRRVPSTVELRAVGGDRYRVVGHGAVFNSLSEDLGGFREIIDPGFFDHVLEDDVRALYNHDPNLILARRKVQGVGGFYRLDQDAVGLAYDFEPTPTSYAADLRVNLATGVVDQSSFAFRVRSGGAVWEEDRNGDLIRRLVKGGASRLFDVSPVAYPAYVAADSGLTSKTNVAGTREHYRARLERVERILAQEERERTVQEDAKPSYALERDARAARLSRRNMELRRPSNVR